MEAFFVLALAAVLLGVAALAVAGLVLVLSLRGRSGRDGQEA
ncbi:hypothetical protein [Nocardioides terrisoli]|nr:hypothetical protein [Nocardioides marmorisolisilvae]